MAPKNSSVGWSPTQLQATQNVELGTKIKCLSCKKNLMQSKFSNKQLNDYRANTVRHGQINAALPSCRTCKGVQRTEMQCSECDLYKSLDFFSKNQRKNPDHARCLDCQQEIDDRLPNVEDALEEMKISEELSNGDFALGSGFSTTASLSGRSQLGSTLGSALSGAARKDNGQPDGVWIPEEGATAGSSFDFTSLQSSGAGAGGVPSVPGSTVSSYIPDSATSNMMSTPYDAFVPNRVQQSYRRTFSSSASSMQTGSARGHNRDFAKTGAEWRKQDPVQKVVMQQEREARRQREQTQSLEDGDDDSDDSEFEL